MTALNLFRGRFVFARGIMSWVKRVFSRRRLYGDLSEEIREHLEEKIEELVAGGMSRKEATYAARREFGNVSLIQEDSRTVWRWPSIENFVADVRYGLRMLRKNPGFTTVAVLTLALGVGANTAIFSVIDQVVLQWLPIRNPEQLFELKQDFLIPEYEKLSARTHSFSGLFASDEGPLVAGIDGESENVRGKFVSGTYYSVMGIDALSGRLITPQDDQRAGPLVCLISGDYWRSRFAQSPEVLGKTITLKRIPFTIVGVAPEFGRAPGADILVPMVTHLQLAMKDNDTVRIIGRLKPGLTEKQANAELTLIYQQILSESAGSNLTPAQQRLVLEKKIQLRPAGRGGLYRFSAQLRIVAAVVGMVLLIACANVANLLLARGTARQREIAVRLAIGAGRWRLIRQLLTESVLLALMAGCLGLLLTFWGGQLLSALISDQPTPVSLDMRVFAFTAFVSVLTGISFGLLPAFQATRINLTPALKEGAIGVGSSSLRVAGSRWGLRQGLVVSQIALSLALLIGAGLLLRSLQHLSTLNVGFDRENVLDMWALPTMVGYDIPQEQSLYWQLLDRLNALPGVQSASLSRLQLFSGFWVRSVSIPGYASGPKEDLRVSCNTTAPKFFATMGIPLLLGRDFTPADSATAPKVAIISESMARQYFRAGNPVGRHFRFSDQDATGDVGIVGVAGDILTEFREEQYNRSPRAAYIPFTQAPPTMTGQAVIEVRTAANPADIAAALQATARAVDKDLPVGKVQTQEEIVNRSLGGERSLSLLTAFFGLLALVLASIGLYGTMSHSIGQRTKEIGIRIALGAEQRNLLNMVLREGMRLAFVGIVAGLAIGVALTRLLSNQLYNLSSTDPLTFAAVSLFLMAVAFVASYIPARRAMRIDPIVALRYE
jgi:predicted permease